MTLGVTEPRADDELSTRVALVTGAHRNLGKAMALALLRRGAKVALTAMSGSFLEDVVAESKAGARALAIPGGQQRRAARSDGGGHAGHAGSGLGAHRQYFHEPRGDAEILALWIC